MNDTPVQVALRQLRVQFTSASTLSILAVLTLVIAVSGPFNTSSLMTLPERLLYWGVVTPATWAAGLFGSILVKQVLAGRHWPGPLVTLSRAAGSTLTVTTLLFGVNALFGMGGLRGWDFLATVASIYVICLAIEVLGEIADRQRPKPAAPGPALPAILQRLPLERRAALISISAVDHYTQVTTLKGNHLILLRLADAVAETAPTPGLQIHRSHWVALGQISKVARVGDGGTVTLSDGRDLPIARSRMAAAQAAGLFPKAG